MRIGAELVNAAGARVAPLGDMAVPLGPTLGGRGLAAVLPVAGLGPGLGGSSAGGSNTSAVVAAPAVLSSPAALSQYGLRLYVQIASSGEIINGGAVRVFALYSE